jgi:prephenate dehydrogenase
MSIHFNNVTIIGVGLIGGSLARVMKLKGLAGSITGAGRNRSTLETAIKIGVIDRMGRALRRLSRTRPRGAASPVGTFKQIMREIGPHLKPGAILTDVGSVKGKLITDIEKSIAPDVHYVPAHPIAGREKSGVAESLETLFQGRRCILTPTEHTDRKALEPCAPLWTAAGADVIDMDADLRRQGLCRVSHLPHVAAFAMMSRWRN